MKRSFPSTRRGMFWRFAGLASALTGAKVHAAEKGTVVNLLDWSGIDLMGVHDSAPQLEAAAAQVSDKGGTLQLPTGQIAVGSFVPIKSGTWVRGQGAGTEIIPFPVAQGFKGFHTDRSRSNHFEYAVFVNVHHEDADTKDSGYHFSDFRIGPKSGAAGNANGDLASPNWNGHLIRMHRCENVLVERVQFRHANDGTAFTACNKTSVLDCQAYDTDNVAFDHWFGGGSHEVRRCTVSGCSWGVLVTGSGTFGEHGVQAGTSIDQVTVTGALQAAIMANCLTAESVVLDWRVTNCHVYGGGVRSNPSRKIFADGIVAHGDVRRAYIAGNELNGIYGTPMLLEAEGYGRPATRGRPPSDCVIEGNIFRNCVPIAPNSKPGPLMWVRGERHKISGNIAVGGIYSIAADVARDTVIGSNRIPPGTEGLYKVSDSRP